MEFSIKGKKDIVNILEEKESEEVLVDKVGEMIFKVNIDGIASCRICGLGRLSFKETRCLWYNIVGYLIFSK